MFRGQGGALSCTQTAARFEVTAFHNHCKTAGRTTWLKWSPTAGSRDKVQRQDGALSRA